MHGFPQRKNNRASAPHAGAALSGRHGTDITTPEKLSAWIKNNPDKCALSANRARSKPLDSQISSASQRSNAKQDNQPGKDVER